MGRMWRYHIFNFRFPQFVFGFSNKCATQFINNEGFQSSLFWVIHQGKLDPGIEVEGQRGHQVENQEGQGKLIAGPALDFESSAALADIVPGFAHKRSPRFPC